MNHYETLGVSNTASADDIKKAYRKLASKHHPDKKDGDTKKFQAIQTAYSTLEDEHKRSQYDQELAGGGPRQFHFKSGGGMPPDMEDVLRAFHQGRHDPFAQFRQPQQPQNRNIRITVPLDLESTLAEQEKTLVLTMPGNKSETVEIKIPRGIYDGATIRYPGLGDQSVAGAPRADLYAQFIVRPHPHLEPVGSDLYMSLTINALEAIIGCEREIKGLDGKEFIITIPPGSQYDSKFGIPDQGLYSVDHPGRGRLVVNLEIYIPKALTKEQLKTISDIAATL